MPAIPTGAQNPGQGTTIANIRTMPTRDWKAALNRLTIRFEDRMPQR
jgi:transposase-like protein